MHPVDPDLQETSTIRRGDIPKASQGQESLLQTQGLAQDCIALRQLSALVLLGHRHRRNRHILAIINNSCTLVAIPIFLDITSGTYKDQKQNKLESLHT